MNCKFEHNLFFSFFFPAFAGIITMWSSSNFSSKMNPKYNEKLIWSVVYRNKSFDSSIDSSFFFQCFPFYALILKLILERNRVIERSNFSISSTFGYLRNRIPPFFSAEESMNSCKESPRYHFRCTHFSLGVSFSNEFPASVHIWQDGERLLHSYFLHSILLEINFPLYKKFGYTLTCS